MRKSIITALFAIATLVAGAQVDDALKLLGKNNGKAKEAIDKLAADPANAKNADVWYAKAQIYNALGEESKGDNMVGMTKDQVIASLGKPKNISETQTASGKEELLIYDDREVNINSQTDKVNYVRQTKGGDKVTVSDAYDQALEAFRKAYEIDPNNKRMLLDLYKTGFIAYEGVANKAATAYQANNIEAAYEGYKKTIDYGDWLRSKDLSYSGYKVPKVDTGMVFMAGYTAMKLNKNDEAIPYFTKLADAKIGKEADYVIPYQFLSYQYKTKKDEPNFKKYTEAN